MQGRTPNGNAGAGRIATANKGRVPRAALLPSARSKCRKQDCARRRRLPSTLREVSDSAHRCQSLGRSRFILFAFTAPIGEDMAYAASTDLGRNQEERTTMASEVMIGEAAKAVGCSARPRAIMRASDCLPKPVERQADIGPSGGRMLGA